MDRYKRLYTYLMVVIVIVLGGVLAACDSSPAPQPTAVVQATVGIQPTSTVEVPASPVPTKSSTEASPTGVSVVGVGDASVSFAEGVAAYNNNDFDAAIAAFNKAIEASPEFEAAYVNGGISYYAKGDNETAYAYMAQAMALDQDDAFAVWVYGLILYRANVPDQAYEAFDYLAQIRPKDPTGYYWRAYSNVVLGDFETAYFDFEEAANLSPDSDMGKGAAAALEKLNNGEEVVAVQAPLPAMKDAQAPEPPQAGPPTEVPAQPGSLVADLGFRPQKDGFSFPNWGAAPDRSDLTPEDLRRMFGDQVCASVANGCILTAAAEAWMKEVNQVIQGGHCEGFAALSLIFYQGKQNPGQFGAPGTFDLNIEANTALQRELAYYWATQFTPPTRTNRVAKKPSEILDTLIDAYKGGANASETYAIEFFQPGFKAGHAVTPYGVEDRGNGQFAILIYDNNHPGIERAMLVDRNAETWQYEAATNPNEQSDLYQGDASTGTLMLTPTSVRLGQQVCTFCENPGGGAVGGSTLAAPDAAQATGYNQLWLEGEAHLLITDKEGRRTGFVDNQFVNEIPGVEIVPITSSSLWEDSPEPVYFVPVGIEFTLVVHNSDSPDPTNSSVSMIGPGYVLSVDDVVLDPGQLDTITFSPDGKSISYKTDYNESPDIFLGTAIGDVEYAFLVKGMDIESGGTMTLNLDPENGWLALDTLGNKEEGTYALIMDRTDAQSEQIFGHGGLTLQPDDVAYVLYGEWKGNGTPLPIGIDHNNDGNIDETVELTDVRE